MKDNLSKVLGLVGIIFAGYWLFINLDWFFSSLSNLNYSFNVLSDPELHLLQRPSLAFPRFVIFGILKEFSFLILPILLGLAGIIKSKSKPVMSGILILAGGCLFLHDPFYCFFLYGCYPTYYVFLIPAVSLIIGGIVILVKDKSK